MRVAGILGLIGSALASPLLAAGADLHERHNHHYGRSRYPTGWARMGKSRYMPHQGPREIARRQRQAARRAAKAGGAS